MPTAWASATSRRSWRTAACTTWTRWATRRIRDLLNKHGDEFLHTVCHTIAKHLAENGIQKATIRHRVKSIYGIYRKMYMQNKDFEEIYDIYAVRIILDNVSECYNALGLIHDMYHPLPNRFKDYISTPKPNGYQSLHTTVIGREAIPFEVQIRTWEMDRIGRVRHRRPLEVQGRHHQRQVISWTSAWPGCASCWKARRSSADAADLLSDIKSDLLREEVFAFTPQGRRHHPARRRHRDRLCLCHPFRRRQPHDRRQGQQPHRAYRSQGADRRDHGNHHRPRKPQGPSRDWLNIVKTSEAKNKIRNWFKKERREENIQEGRDALERELRRNLMSMTDEQHDVFYGGAGPPQPLQLAWMRCMRPSATAVCRSARMLPKLKEEYTKLKATEVKACDRGHQADALHRRRRRRGHRQLPHQVCQVLLSAARG